MKLTPNSPPETFPDDQAYDVPMALKERARDLELESSQHSAKAEYFKEHGVDEDIVEEEETRGLEFLSQIKQLRWIANILRMTSNKK